MANCRRCEKRLGFLGGENGLCPDCKLESVRNNNIIANAEDLIRAQEKADRARAQAEIVAIERVMLTTETAGNFNVTKRFSIISAECVFGVNVLKEVLVGARDLFGGRSETLQKLMKDARATVLMELKKEAHELGANAVVGVSLNYLETGGQSTMVLLSGVGTAVTVEQKGQDDFQS